MQPLYFEQIQEDYFPLCETPQKGTLVGRDGVDFGKIFICNGTHAIPHPKGLCIHTILVL